MKYDQLAKHSVKAPSLVLKLKDEVSRLTEIINIKASHFNLI